MLENSFKNIPLESEKLSGAGLYFSEKFITENLPLCDSHIHLAQCVLHEKINSPPSSEYFSATCIHSKEEWETFCALEKSFAFSPSFQVKKAFGLHPQKVLVENASFLENLCAREKIDAVGEAGFDFYSEDFRKDSALQEKAFQIELELCETFSLPLVVHERKALEMIYRYSSELKRLPSVLFHSFFHGRFEAESILKKGINAFFSFGKQILNGNKKAIECVKNLPEERLLLETDAPFQTLKGESFTSFREIIIVYKAAMNLRGIENVSRAERFAFSLKNNFFNLFK